MKKLNVFIQLAIVVVISLILKFLISEIETENVLYESALIISKLAIGGFVIYNIARFLEDITAIMKDKTGLAGGLLQALGTAFPDMILGIMAAILSLKVVKSDPTLSIEYAIIAASTTFGSNIYNISHAAWCIYRQNLANKKNAIVKMFPFFGGGNVSPLNTHITKPTFREINNAIKVLISLTTLTVVTVLGMVFLGKTETPVGMTGELYQLKVPVAVLLLITIFLTLYVFRKNYGSQQEEDNNPFTKVSNLVMWISLIICGISILFTAEVMVEAISRLSAIAHIPTVVSGLIIGIIGCLGEMMVIHNFTVNPKGRIGDAVVGVAMDNIVTIMGASLIALMGGIFLGGDSLIVIFVVILGANSLLIWQVAELKDDYVDTKVLKDTVRTTIK